MESEVVAFSDYLPYKIHMVNIFFVKCYVLHKKVFYQDSKSAINMDKMSEIYAQVIQGTFPSDLFLLGIAWIRSSLVSSTATHQRLLPTS